MPCDSDNAGAYGYHDVAAAVVVILLVSHLQRLALASENILYKGHE